jgi:hypothetical protein
VVASAESIGRPVDTRGLGGGSVVPEAAAIQTGLTWDVLARDQQGYATTNALLAVTTGLGVMPGRKSVLFFAEGLAIPDAVLPHFKDVVTTANRGNVSVYTIDGAGLRVHSTDAATGRAVRAMGDAGLAINPDGSNRSDLRMLEQNEDFLRRDPRTSLTLLAEQTGGFLIEGTNELGPGLRRIETDRRFHYLLTYTPSNRNLDGTWRSITVQVPNRRVSIRARSGYLAVDRRWPASAVRVRRSGARRSRPGRRTGRPAAAGGGVRISGRRRQPRGRARRNRMPARCGSSQAQTGSSGPTSRFLRGL